MDSDFTEGSVQASSSSKVVSKEAPAALSAVETKPTAVKFAVAPAVSAPAATKPAPVVVAPSAPARAAAPPLSAPAQAAVSSPISPRGEIVAERNLKVTDSEVQIHLTFLGILS